MLLNIKFYPRCKKFLTTINMSLIRKYFASEEKEEVALTISSTPTAVLVKRVKYFDIYEDGNGMIRAQHVTGKWLRNKDNLTDFYENSMKFSSIEDCHEWAGDYIKTTQLQKIGTIEFIPSPKGKVDDNL